jgi:hypothetical protein
LKKNSEENKGKAIKAKGGEGIFKYVGNEMPNY